MALVLKDNHAVKCPVAAFCSFFSGDYIRLKLMIQRGTNCRVGGPVVGMRKAIVPGENLRCSVFLYIRVNDR